MEVLGNVTLLKQGLQSVLASIDNENGKTELVAIAWVDRNRCFFLTRTCGLGKGEMIQCKCLRQLDKSGQVPPDKVIIKVAQPNRSPTTKMAPAPSTDTTGFVPTSCGWTTILPPRIGQRGSTSESSALFALMPTFFTNRSSMQTKGQQASSSSLEDLRTSSSTIKRGFLWHGQRQNKTRWQWQTPLPQQCQQSGGLLVASRTARGNITCRGGAVARNARSNPSTPAAHAHTPPIPPRSSSGSTIPC